MLTEKADKMGCGIEMQPFRNLFHIEYRVREQPFCLRKQFLVNIRFGGSTQ